MNRIILTCLFAVIFFSAFSQSYPVEWGSEQKRSRGLVSHYYLAGMTGDYYHVMSNSIRDIKLSTFDINHKLVEEQDLDIRQDGNRLMFNNFIETSAGYFGFFSCYIDNTINWQLYFSSFNDNKLDQPQLALESTFGRVTPTTINYKSSYVNNLETSSDKGTVSFVHKVGDKIKEERAEFIVATFDEKMNLLWEKNQEIPYPSKRVELMKSVVNNKGEVYLLARVYESNSYTIFNKNGYNISLDYAYKVFKITENNIEEFAVGLQDNLLVTEAAIFSPENDIDEFWIGGMYTTDEHKIGQKGVFVAKTNQETGNIDVNIHPFEKEFLDGLIKERDLKSDRGLSYFFKIKNLVTFPDGSFAFITESNHTTSTNLSSIEDPNNFNVNVTYHSNQIVISRFSQEGDLLNVAKIDKYFKANVSHEMSYAYALLDGRIFLLYSDKKDLDERPVLKENGFLGGPYTDLTIIDEKGKIEFQNTIFSNEDTDLIFTPSQFTYNNEHLLILGVSGFGIGGNVGNRYKFGTINLD